MQVVDGEIYATALDDEGKWLYFRDHKARFGRMEIANPENVEILNDKCGDIDKNVSYLAWSPVDKCFYMSLQNKHGIYKISHDGKTVEMFAGFNGVGSQDGPKMSASFKTLLVWLLMWMAICISPTLWDIRFVRLAITTAW